MSRLDDIPNTEIIVYEKQANQKSQHDHRAHQRDVSVGQHVLVCNFRPGLPWLPGKITHFVDPVSVLVPHLWLPLLFHPPFHL